MSDHELTGVNISIKEEAGRTLIRFDGELDASNVNEVHQLIEVQLQGQLQSPVFVLEDLRYADSRAFSLFLRLHKVLTYHGQEPIFIISQDHQVRRMLELIGLTKILIVREELTAPTP